MKLLKNSLHIMKSQNMKRNRLKRCMRFTNLFIVSTQKRMKKSVMNLISILNSSKIHKMSLIIVKPKAAKTHHIRKSHIMKNTRVYMKASMKILLISLPTNKLLRTSLTMKLLPKNLSHKRNHPTTLQPIRPHPIIANLMPVLPSKLHHIMKLLLRSRKTLHVLSTTLKNSMKVTTESLKSSHTLATMKKALKKVKRQSLTMKNLKKIQKMLKKTLMK
mmetsp:Transcript_20998/g.20852  ORF Transcript_20998/g.20852 Transcript_20998/m.20852 type:complete len:218 (-) Transcript_20998:12-665(-)